MASKFYAGMTNVVEALNDMWVNFAAGPYNALPLTGGTLSGALYINTPNVYGRYNSSTAGTAYLALAYNGATYAYLGQATATTGGGSDIDFGIRAESNMCFSTNGYRIAMKLHASGNLVLGTESNLADNGSDRLQVVGTVKIVPTGNQASLLFQAGIAGSNASVTLFAGDGVASSQPAAVMYTLKNSNTGRSINSTGTVNTIGNDYAEYIHKGPDCTVIAKGQIIGITAANMITDQWADAVMFAIKSTAPSFVGGDSWASGIGPRPVPQAGPTPTLPPRRGDVIEQPPLAGTEPPEYQDVARPGDTDAEWAAKQAVHAAAIAAHNSAVLHDAEQMATFDAALEVERQKVDRIAIAGRVPVNVLGARPGDYIVPVQDGEGIAGTSVHADDITLAQYLRAVGRVISIEPDGRAYVMVKAV